MKRLLAKLLGILVCSCMALALQAQQQPNSAAQEQQREQERQAAAAREAEARRAAEEAARQSFMNEIKMIDPRDGAKTAPRLAPEPCVSGAPPQGSPSPAPKAPLEEWLASVEKSQIPWKFRVEHPLLRMDQRFEVAYAGEIDVKNLHWADGANELIFASGVSGSDGRQIIAPKLRREDFKKPPPNGARLRYTGCVFLQPGQYVVWAVVSDPRSGRRSVVKRDVRVPDIPSDPMPNLNSRLASAEFPRVFRGAAGAAGAPNVYPGPMFLPVANQRRIAVELVSILSPPDQWVRGDLINWINNRTLAAAGILSQMQVKNGFKSIYVVDLENRATPFTQQEFRQLNWTGLASAFSHPEDAHKVTLPALETRNERSSFLHDWLRERLTGPRDTTTHVVILMSGSVIFKRGSDISALQLERECNCRMYHLLFRINNNDLFDDVGRLTGSLPGKRFDIRSPLDFRKALARIVQDLESLQ